MIETHFPRPRWDAVNDIMQQGLKSTFPAAVLLIQQAGERLFHRPYGWIDPDRKRWPVRRDVLFDLASLTKLFTAAAFMTLVQAGKITLETPVSEVVSEFGGIHPLQPGIDPHSKTALSPVPEFDGKMVNADLVTFRHLLTHTSGLAAWDDFCRGGEDDAAATHLTPQAMRRHRLNAFLKSPRFVYPPGEQFLYSDLGFILLGEAIERLSGMPLPDYLARAVFRPLGVTCAMFNPFAHGSLREDIAPTEFCAWRGRRIWGEAHDENAACLDGVAGHAGLFATARDVAAFGQSFLDEGGAILAPELAREMIREQVQWRDARRGLGWQLPGNDGAPVGLLWSRNGFGHTGFTGASLWIDPIRALVVVLLTNRVYHGRDGEAIARFRVQLHEAVATVVDDFSENTP